MEEIRQTWDPQQQRVVDRYSQCVTENAVERNWWDDEEEDDFEEETGQAEFTIPANVLMDDTLLQDLPDCGDTVASVTVIENDPMEMSALTSFSQEQERKLEAAARAYEVQQETIKALEARIAMMGGVPPPSQEEPSGGAPATSSP